MATPLLELRNVTKVFQSGIRKTAASTTVALRDSRSSSPASSPTSTAVAGESGSGKTTMARLLLGFIKPTSGQIIYQGVDVAKMDRRPGAPVPARGPADLPGPVRGLQPVLQDRPRADDAAAATSASRRTAKDVQRRMEEALELVGLRPQETLGRYPARAIRRPAPADHGRPGAHAAGPKIIMADEPVSMVDASLRATILDELRKLNTEFGISLLYITHDLTTAYQVCDNIVVLYQGSVAEAGSVERVIRAPKHPYTQLLVSSIPRHRPRPSAGAATRSSLPEASAGRRDRGLPVRAALPVRRWTSAGPRSPPLFQIDPRPGRVLLPAQGAPGAAIRADRRGLPSGGDRERRLTTRPT